jgi:prepilin-type processing-associated H-X9-DG protein
MPARLHRMVVWTIALSITGVLCGRADAQPLAEHVPADATVYLGWSGIDSMGPGFEGSNFQGFLKAVDVPRLSEQVLGMVKTFAGSQDRQAATGIDLLAEIVGAAWRNPTAIYFAGVDESNPRAPMPRVALICKMGPAAAALREKVIATAGAPPAPIVFESIDGMLVLASGIDLQVVLKPAASLAASARFKEAMGLTHQPAASVLYVDVPALVKMGSRFVQRQMVAEDFATYLKVLEATGVNGVGRVVVSGGLAGKDWTTAAFLEAPAPRKGLIKLLESGPIDRPSLKAVPVTAPWVTATHFDFARAYETVLEAVREIDPQALPQVQAVVAQASQAVGFDIVNDLLGAMGSDWIVYSDVSLGGPPTATLAMVHPLRDAAKFDRSLTIIEERIRPMLEGVQQEGFGALQLQRIQSGDVTIRSVNVLVYAPSWAVHEGRLVVGMFPQAVAAAVENAKGQGPSILEEPKFTNLMKRLGDRPVSAISYTDLPQTAPHMYQLAVMGVQFIQAFSRQQGVQGQLILPPLGRLMPYFKPSAQIGWSDDKGIHARGVSPFPGSTVFAPTSFASGGVAGSALAVGILLPSLGRARELANRSMCGTRMTGVYMASRVWAMTHDGTFPPDLGSLVEDGSISTRNLICPSSPRFRGAESTFPADPQQWRQWSNDHSDFIYLAARKKADELNADDIFLYERLDHHKGEGINICFGDGHVAFTPMAEAVRLLRAAGQKVQAPAAGSGGGLGGLCGGSGRQAPASPGEAWYYDTVTSEYFTDLTTKVAPYKNARGNESVRAHFFTCGDCTEEQRFIGYYEKYTDEVKARIEEKQDSFMIYEMAFQGRLYSRDGKKWVPADKPEGIAITSELQRKCPPKKLRYCPPQ